MPSSNRYHPTLPELQGAPVPPSAVPAPPASLSAPISWTRLSHYALAASPEPAFYGDSYEVPLPAMQVHVPADPYAPAGFAEAGYPMAPYGASVHAGADWQSTWQPARGRERRKGEHALIMAGTSLFVLCIALGMLTCTYYVLKCFGIGI